MNTNISARLSLRAVTIAVLAAACALGPALAQTPASADAVRTTDAVATIAPVSPPMITGTPEVGQTVTATPGTWDDPGATFAYQWQSAGSDIDGATGTSYTITPAVSGKPLTVFVTATGTDGSTATIMAAPVDVPAVAPQPTRWLPSIQWGATEVAFGEPLSIEPGGWDIPDATFSFQWQMDGVDIPGATTDTYTAAHEDMGRSLTAVVTATANGLSSEPVTTAPVRIGKGYLTFDVLPSTSGDARVGSTLTIDPGTWHHDGVTVSYQWLGDGPIEGATGQTYTLRAADLGLEIRALVELNKPDYWSNVAFTGPVTVAKGDISAVTAPRVVGIPQAGRTLRVQPAGWSTADGVSRSYQWTAGGTPINGATGTTFTLPASMVGKRIAVVETASGAAYNEPVSQTSAGLTVRKATSEVVLKLGTPARGKVRAVVVVSASVKVAGAVTVKLGKAVRRVRLVGGKATTTFSRLDRGRAKVTARYPGTSMIAAGSDSATIRVR